MSKADNRLTGFFGRNLPIGRSAAAALEVALPVRDQGIGLIACWHGGRDMAPFPLRVRAAVTAGGWAA